MMEKAEMEIASMTSAIFVTQENWDAMQSRTINVIFCDNVKFFSCENLAISFSMIDFFD